MISIYRYQDVQNEQIFSRFVPVANLGGTVSEILETVRRDGDRALYAYAERFDRAVLSSLTVDPEEIREAAASADPDFLRILQNAASNIRAFHEKQKRNSFIINEESGIVLGQKVLPIERVGLYIPGGTAAYPSTVLMNAIPAKIAGCKEVVIATPPRPDGSVHPAILTAACVAGVDRIYKVGGAQAIAALAYGTETVGKVDKIVGPGNAYVAEAKKQVFGIVSIDMIAGPSEILIVSDGNTDPAYAAADLLSQAEHDKMASAVLVTDSFSFAEAVRDELERQLPLLERADIARASIDANGKIIVTDTIARAIEIANRIAPEHLELCLDDPFDYLDAVRNAGSVFLGRDSPEALGDYYAGPNHTLPTSGTARFSSPLSVDDFIKKTQFIYYTKEALGKVAKDVAAFATREGLTAHAKSAVIRTEDDR